MAHVYVFASEDYLNCLSTAVVRCGGPPAAPINGQRIGSGTTYNSVVTYSCDTNYILNGSRIRTCQSNGQWSGRVTQCNRKLCWQKPLSYTECWDALVLQCTLE